MTNQKSTKLYVVSMVLCALIVLLVSYLNMLKNSGSAPLHHFVPPIVIGLIIGYLLASTLKLRITLKQLEGSREQYKELIDDIGGHYIVYSHTGGMDGIFTYVSGCVQSLIGIPPEALIGKRWDKVVEWTAQSISDSAAHFELMATSPNKNFERDLSFDLDGQRFTLHVVEHCKVGTHGELVSVHGVAEDISARIENEHRMRLGASVFENSNEAMIVTDASARIIQVNPAFTQLTGYRAEEIIGNTPSMLKSGEHDGNFYRDMWQSLEQNDHWSGEITNLRKCGQRIVERLTINTVRDETDEIIYFIGVIMDVTQMKENENALIRQAHFDSLTGLPNRTLLVDRIGQAREHAKRHHTHFAVAFMDLDGFKAINDNHGHHAGDYLLKETAHRLKDRLRAVDTVSRLGGDEFVFLLDHLDNHDDAQNVLERIIHEVAQPVHYGDARLQVTGSIGVTYYDKDRDPVVEDMLRSADYAMYDAKRNGKNQIHYYH